MPRERLSLKKPHEKHKSVLKKPLHTNATDEPLIIETIPRFMVLTNDGDFKNATTLDLSNPEKTAFIAITILGEDFNHHFSYWTGKEYPIYETMIGPYHLTECTLISEVGDKDIFAIASLSDMFADFVFGKLVEDHAYNKIQEAFQAFLANPTCSEDD